MSKKYNNTISNFKNINKVTNKKVDSFEILKNKITFENLRENLLSSVQTSSEENYFRETYCETQKNSTLKKTLKEMLQYKKNGIQLSRNLLSDKEGIFKKEKNKALLESEYEEYRKENDYIKTDIILSEKVHSVSNKNNELMSEYREELKFKYKDFVATVDRYEENIKQTQREKEDMINSYEDSISTMNLDSDKLAKENSKIRNKIEKQRDMVNNQKEQYKKINEELINEQKAFELKEKENKVNYDEFMIKIRNLQNKIDEFKKLSEIEVQNEMIINKEKKEKNELEEIKMKLYDIEHQNQFLNTKIYQAEKQLQEIGAIQSQPTYEERLKMIKNKKLGTKIY